MTTRRRVPGGSFLRLTAPDALWAAWRRVARGRRRRLDIARFDLDADTHVFRLHRALRDGTWAPRALRVRTVRDPKPRLVAVAAVEERIVQQSLVAEIEPPFLAGFRPESYAVGRGRGPLRAVLAALRLARRHRFRAALDVASYFRWVRHDTLRALLARRIGDPGTLGLVDRLLRHGGDVYQRPSVVDHLGPTPLGVGLPLGSYLSHFAGGLYLDRLDHHLTREWGAAAYLRYMDDLVIFHDDPVQLGLLVARTTRWLSAERGLVVKPRTGLVVPCRRPHAFLGWRITPAGLKPAAKLRRNLADRLRAAAFRGPGPLARSIAAWKGLLTF